MHNNKAPPLPHMQTAAADLSPGCLLVTLGVFFFQKIKREKNKREDRQESDAWQERGQARELLELRQERCSRAFFLFVEKASTTGHYH